jgi:hypothetical protein
LQIQVGASASEAPNKKPHRTSRRLRLMACRFAAQFLGLGAVADNAPLLRQASRGFSSPRHQRELHVANRDLGTVEHINSNGDLESGWTQARKPDSTSASTRTLTMVTQ